MTSFPHLCSNPYLFGFFSLKDLVVRTETNKLVTDLVNLDRIQSLLKTIFHRRRFLRYKQDIPVIVAVRPTTTPNITQDISTEKITDG
jgi:hypothetical protein